MCNIFWCYSMVFIYSSLFFAPPLFLHGRGICWIVKVWWNSIVLATTQFTLWILKCSMVSFWSILVIVWLFMCTKYIMNVLLASSFHQVAQYVTSNELWSYNISSIRSYKLLLAIWRSVDSIYTPHNIAKWLKNHLKVQLMAS